MFCSDYMTTDEFESSFYVEKYSIPSFDVGIFPYSQGFILENDKTFKFVVNATLVFKI